MGRLSYSPVRIEATMRSMHSQPQVYSVVSLPVEIIIIISEELLAMGSTSGLAALSLLGKNYAGAVQQKLFHHIEIRTYGRYARLMRTLQFGGSSPERCYALASMIRCLSVDLNQRPPQGEPPLNPHHLFNLCDNLPMLNSVDLNESPMSGLGRLLVPTEEDLDLLAMLTPLRSLTLTGSLAPVGRSMIINLPRLRELHLSGHIPVSLFSHAHPRSGRSLRRLTWGSTTPPTLRWIRWIFSESEELIDGEIVLLALPNSESELDAIRRYALQRGMAVQVAGSVVVG
ncbi:hypothetical protein V565_039740 [Rhizoctonia solani 123E]|uniref:F-box-like domain protein n=1 Tax=Rhizoctonia solani 123E TaxID=1423351 RepID=A0A074S7I3_9AGAM|nr:hypothetical protein V565_039740 [Rhizoctonia solani 123E]